MNTHSIAPFIQEFYPQYYSIERYPVSQCAAFSKKDNEWGVFSNFGRTPILVDGITFKNVEQLYQLMKFKDEEPVLLIYKAPNPKMPTLNIPASVDSTYMTSVSYSVDNGATWNTTTIDNTAQTITTPTINTGSKVLWKGVGKQMASSTSSGRYSQFSSTGNFSVSGNIMSLLYGDEFTDKVNFANASKFNFSRLFISAKITNTDKLILPATTLTASCYSYMFNACTSLTTAPELPATTLEGSCYSFMFYNCTSLTTAPELPATTLTASCYNSMFYGCSSLNYIKAMFTTTPGTHYTQSWLGTVSPTGTFVKNSAATWNVTGPYGIPTGWTVETASA